MEESLRSASHDAQLLRQRLNHALGGTTGLVTMSAARSATVSVLAEDATHGDFAISTALRCSTIPTIAESSEYRHTCSPEGLIDDKWEVDNAGNEKDTGREAAGVEQHAAGDTSKNQVNPQNNVDRASLVSRLAAEERLAAMANHLGWSEPLQFPWMEKSTSFSSRTPSQAIATTDPTTVTHSTEIGPTEHEMSLQRGTIAGVERRAYSAEESFLRAGNNRRSAEHWVFVGSGERGERNSRRKKRNREEPDAGDREVSAAVRSRLSR